MRKLLIPRFIVDERTYKQRMDLCRTCPARIRKEGNQFSKSSRCPECKCFCYLKTKLKDQECPNGDWGQVPM